VQQGDDIILSVIDTGIGIPPEHLEKIFEEFQQVEGELNRRYQGTGLGLPICRKLIELHGGTIKVASTPGTGSTFTIILPISSREEADQVAPLDAAQLAAVPTGQLLMVVDDDLSAIEIVTTYLSRNGYTIHAVTDSRVALEEAQRVNPAAILLDILMPHKDGWEVLAELKADAATKAIPVGLYTLVDEKKLGFYLGASAYLVKPVDEEQLRDTVTKLVAENKTILIIDDDADAREIVVHHLQQIGPYRLLEAKNGLEGLQRIAEQRPDLIILDLMMPEVDGFALLNQLDEQPELRELPVVVITAKSLTREEQERLNQRVQGLIAKGNETPEQLLKRVSDLLHSAPRVRGMTVVKG
jgi:CheY-like chemotaxis protein